MSNARPNLSHVRADLQPPVLARTRRGIFNSWKETPDEKNALLKAPQEEEKKFFDDREELSSLRRGR